MLSAEREEAAFGFADLSLSLSVSVSQSPSVSQFALGGEVGQIREDVSGAAPHVWVEGGRGVRAQ